MMNDNKITIEQTVDILIEGARKTSNTLMLETAKLIKAALINNQHSELMKIMTLTIKDTKMVITHVQRKFPTAQKGTIVKIFKSLL